MQITIDASNWKLRQYRDFMVAAKAGDFDGVIKLLPSLVTSWSLPGDVKDTDYWLDNLSLKDWIDITQAVNVAITKEFEAPKK